MCKWNMWLVSDEKPSSLFILHTFFLHLMWKTKGLFRWMVHMLLQKLNISCHGGRQACPWFLHKSFKTLRNAPGHRITTQHSFQVLHAFPLSIELNTLLPIFKAYYGASKGNSVNAKAVRTACEDKQIKHTTITPSVATAPGCSKHQCHLVIYQSVT